MGIFNGTPGDDILVGGDGDDTLNGAGGDDTLSGGLGANTIDGGSGVDTVDYSWAPIGVKADLSVLTAQQVLGQWVNSSEWRAATDTLVGIENIRGSAQNDELWGDLGSNLLEGGAGNDVLFDGKGGADDILRGGSGNDSLQTWNGSTGVHVAHYYGEDGDDNLYVSDDNAQAEYWLSGGDGDDRISASRDAYGSAHTTIDAGAGDDYVAITYGDDYRITLGAGRDWVTFYPADQAMRATITDFQVTGASSDVIDLGAFISYTLSTLTAYLPPRWDQHTNPFADGYLRLTQTGADTWLEMSAYPGGSYQPILVFSNTVATSFTAASFAGYDPLGGPVLGMTLTGHGALDFIKGAGGADIIQGGDGQDQIESGLGDDVVHGNAGTDVLDDNSGNDQLYGDDGNDILRSTRSGKTFFDTIVMDGGVGDDDIDFASYYRTSSATVTLTGGEGSDYIRLWGSTRAVVEGGAGDDRLQYYGFDNPGVSVLSGGDGDDFFYLTLSDEVILQGGAGDDGAEVRLIYTLSGDLRFDGRSSAQNNLITLNGATKAQLQGIERITFYAESGNDVIYGGSGKSEIHGGAGDDELGAGAAGATLYGDDGNDLLVGGPGDDTLDGGAGQDTLHGGDGSDLLIGGPDADTLDGGAGIDTASYAAALSPGVTVNLATGVATADGSTDTLTNVENVVGSALADHITGDDDDNVLDGGGGNDILEGGPGSDTLLGGAGDDLLRGGLRGASYGSTSEKLDGGSGVDLAAYDEQNFQVTVNLESHSAYGLGFIHTLSNIEDVLGSAFADTLTGDAGANRIDGGLGDDLIAGGGGNDVLLGGGGHDTVSFAGDTAGLTVDLVDGQAGGVATGVDVLVGFSDVILGFGGDSAYGDAAANLINGGEGDNYIDGRGGDDKLYGGGGNNVLVGGDGNDQLGAGEGANLLIGGAGNDRLSAGGHSILIGGVGDDHFTTGDNGFVSYEDATSGVTVSALIHVAQDVGGGRGMDTLESVGGLRGSDFNDVLKAAQVQGGKGDDILTGYGFLGTALYDDATSGVTVDLSITSAQNVGGGLGADTLSGILNLVGSAFDDVLTGDASNNRFDGGGGSNVLNGGGGDDTLMGGAGADVLNGGAGVDFANYSGATSGIDLQMVFTVAQNTLGGGIDTLIGIEGVQGSAFNDVIAGDAGVNRLGGGAGDDLLKGGGGDDILYGGQYNYPFTIQTNYSSVEGKDVLEGGAGDDLLYAGDYVGGDDILRGGAGNDRIISENKVMAVYGDDGDDRFEITGGDRQGVMDGGTGTDVLQARDVNIAALQITGVETLAGSNVTATVAQFTAFTQIGAFLGSTSTLALASGGVIDFSKNAVGAVSVTGSDANDDITGTTGADTLYANAGNDILHGGLGNDTLYAGLGADQLFGGAGDDFLGRTMNFSGAADTGTDRFWGEAGADTFSIGSDGGMVALDGGADNDLFYLGGGLVGTVEGGTGVDAISSSDIHNLTVTDVERLIGGTTATAAQFAAFTAIESYNGPGAITDLVLATAGAVNFSLNVLAGSWISVTGSSGADVITGTDGADTLNGADGEDTLNGGAGADTLNGGAGYDVASYGSAKSGVTVSLAATGQQNTGGAGVDTLIGVEGLIGSAFDDTLQGGALRAIMEGGAGDDRMYGGAGDDLLLGGLGNDHLYGGGGADVLSGDAGFDFVRYDLSASGLSIDLAAGTAGGGDAQGDSLIDIEGVVGGAFADAIYGGNADNVFYGQGGNDVLRGGGGADTLDGGDGDDTLDGGAGADLLNGGAGYDVASYASARSSVTVNLAASGAQDTGGGGIDVLTSVEGLVGSAYNDVLSLSGAPGGVRSAVEGGAGDDRLYGAAGADYLLGGSGADHLYGSAGADILDGGADFDFVRYDTSSAGVAIDLGSNASGGDAQGDSLVGIEGIVGSAFADVMFGREGDNIFHGQGGNDVLRGGAGNDVLNGGDGDDNLTGGTGGDALRGGAGFDVARYDDLAGGAVVNLTTGVNSGSAQGDVLTDIEGLQGTSYSGDDLTGDGGANSIYGLGGDDVLRGMGGDDVLDGGDGSDHLYGGTGADVLRGGTFVDLARYDNAAEGVWVDLAQGKGFTGEAAGDTLVQIEGLVGSGHGDTLVGDSAINILYGQGGDDVLVGGDGGDTLEGGAGNDHVYGGAGGDVLRGGEGVDLARYDTSASGVWVDLNQGVGLAGEAAGDTFNAIEGVIGSASADTLIGNAGGNTFYGQAGDDTLDAGAGSDTLFGGAGADTFVYGEIADSTAAQKDRIWDFSLADHDRIDLSAIDADTATGQDDAFTLAAALTGQAGQAVLTYDQAQDATNLALDVNGDGLADFLLTINGHLTTTEGLIL